MFLLNLKNITLEVTNNQLQNSIISLYRQEMGLLWFFFHAKEENSLKPLNYIISLYGFFSNQHGSKIKYFRSLKNQRACLTVLILSCHGQFCILSRTQIATTPFYLSNHNLIKKSSCKKMSLLYRCLLCLCSKTKGGSEIPKYLCKIYKVNTSIHI